MRAPSLASPAPITPPTPKSTAHPPPWSAVLARRRCRCIMPLLASLDAESPNIFTHQPTTRHAATHEHRLSGVVGAGAPRHSPPAIATAPPNQKYIRDWRMNRSRKAVVCGADFPYNEMLRIVDSVHECGGAKSNSTYREGTRWRWHHHPRPASWIQGISWMSMRV